MRVEEIEPHGFCWGVTGALEKARASLSFSRPVCTLHPLVHNADAMAGLYAAGLRLVASLDEIPAGAALLLSAHGSAPSLRTAARARGLATIDATCPFVARTHRAVVRFAERGFVVVVAGDARHVEVEALVGEAEARGARVHVVATPEEVAALDVAADAPVGFVCQTTFDAARIAALAEALRKRFARVEIPAAASACTATRDRQNAVKDFVARARRAGAPGVGVVVVGGETSANVKRLVDVARAAGADFAVRVARAEECAAVRLPPLAVVGVTSGASTPEDVYRAVVAALRARAGQSAKSGVEK